MNAMRTTILAASVAFAGAFATGSASAQVQGERSIEQYSCKDVMRDSGSGREVAIAFLHGFLLGKSGSSKFDVEILSKQTDAFIDSCLSNPDEKASDAMLKVKN